MLELLRSTELGAITEHPLFFREPGDCEVYGAGRVTLLGDAAHLTAAALGQVGPRGGVGGAERSTVHTYSSDEHTHG